MDNEIPLPPPRRLRHRSSSRAGPSPAPSVAPSFHKSRRLSRFDDRSSQPSSDPALFSSDDIPASGLENYNAPVAGGPGRKRRYRGTWWGEQAVDPKRKRADFKEKRHVDSGVWMGSDESLAESSLPSEDGPAWGEDLLKSVLDPQGQGRFPLESSTLRAPTPVQAQSRPIPVFIKDGESEEHRIAKAIVNNCLEKGEDSIDLGNLNLKSIGPGLLAPLQHLTKLPSVTEPPTSENAYTSLQPFLRIFLPNNNLTNLGSELFELKDLKVLSVRSNKLTMLPANIRNLTSLQVLNIAVNELTSLPWELLGLLQGELKHFSIYPNPFPSIEETIVAVWRHGSSQEGEPSIDEVLKFNEYEGEPPSDAWTAIRVATGPVNRLDMDGRPVQPSSSHSANHAPSLRELSLRTLVKMPGLDQITEEELLDFPPLAVPLIAMAQKWHADGGWHCSVCHKEYVNPRSQWTEWWDCTPHENGMKRPRTSGEKLRPLPFSRFGCSWACVPDS
ncbi:uncharacterized protein N7443_010251 [Penicillium atrosanguineum]|uniref:uncharacterized protein n=1 Tax=Penicillium atrosanguineum TaxID=1132637 RepID=UPI002387210B|nr:uncharacterized protein N7443_010251 [Penicillium atrosanguineum]KAJ5137456.1 hypothetical protein N7526_003689 [Penicillium atrosanguineum]KAJ5289998.1 hypothetical protein N7443_010251 [Penicillium atrosanguineum]